MVNTNGAFPVSGIWIKYKKVIFDTLDSHILLDKSFSQIKGEIEILDFKLLYWLTDPNASDNWHITPPI